MEAEKYMKNLAYTFMVIKEDRAKPSSKEFESLFTTSNDEEYEELKQFLIDRNAGLRRASYARNSKEVIAIHIDPSHDKWTTTPGKNGLLSQPIKTGQRFESANAASGSLGLRHNEVAQLLSRTAATGEFKATIRGVTFCYAEDLPKAKKK
jgi:hypothetical protein